MAILFFAALLLFVSAARARAEGFSVQARLGDSQSAYSFSRKGKGGATGRYESGRVAFSAALKKKDFDTLLKAARALPEPGNLPAACERGWIEVKLSPGDGKLRKACVVQRLEGGEAYQKFARTLRWFRLLYGGKKCGG
jgi:hypothetical protein